MLRFENVSFRYPGQERDAIQDISFEIKSGEFVLLCGESGCGKTTLLRHTKKNQIPTGKGSGKMYFCGKDLEQLDDVVSVSEIGYVGQSPDGQIVTDKVWHELAFGLESMGVSQEKMHRQIAEMSEYFGIGSWYDKKTSELSGGQKQILNLASVMVMHPKLLILDEPTSQLDPIASEKFLQNIYKLNRDFGVTILICEQRVHEVIAMVDRVMLMQDGKIISFADVEQSVVKMKQMGSKVYEALPGFMKLWCEQAGKADGTCPMNIRDAKIWLEQVAEGKRNLYGIKEQEKGQDAEPVSEKEKSRMDMSRKTDTETLLRAHEVVFSYETGKRLRGHNAQKVSKVLKDFSIDIERGYLYAIMGGNGSGKTTALKLLAGIYQPQQGSVEKTGKVVYLPQNPQTVFTEITVNDELQEVFTGHKAYAQSLSKEEMQGRIQHIVEKMELSALTEKHPFDLSVGQQQRLALAKVLLLEPEVLLLDEPTKGLDGTFKKKLAGYLKEFVKEGLAIVMVSHDIAFCAEYADWCSLLFDGELTKMQMADEFFRQNYFYTTDICRMFSKSLSDDNQNVPVRYAQAKKILESGIALEQ